MNIKDQVQKMDELVAQGAILDAVKTYFADHATTSDFSGVTTGSKAEMIEKMTGFTNAIAEVKSITKHQSIVDENRSATEFTFHFGMTDNTEVLWHEIIQRRWNDAGKVVEEQYFKA